MITIPLIAERLGDGGWIALSSFSGAGL